MNTEYDNFLLIAEEKNISRAAKRAYVSQQNLSKYLKQLEERLGVQLFTRKPSFNLTPAGQLVLEKVRQIKAISLNMEEELAELNQSNVGDIRFGCSIGRGLQLLPIVFPPLRQRYPNIHLEAKFGMTQDLATWTINGKLDFFLGLSISPSLPLEIIKLAHEKIFVAISDNLLLRYFPNDFPSCKYRFINGIDLQEFVHVPFMINPQISSMHVVINNFCQEINLHLNYVATINSNALQISLAAKDCAACFFPQFLTAYGNILNSQNGSLQHLNFFPIKGLDHVNDVELAYRKNKHISEPDRCFVALIREAFLNYPINSFCGVELPTSF